MEELNIPSLKKILKNNKPLIIEIGCNDGNHTKKFIKTFPEATIFAFEPDPRAQKRFAENIKNDKRITLVKKAISAQNGSVKFYMSNGFPNKEWEEKLPEGWDLSGSIRKPKNHLKYHKWCTFDHTINVETQKLDDFCEENKINFIDFIWADVQGAEVDLIKGGLKSLSFTNYIYTEYNDNKLYKGQINLKKILKLLPNFSIHTLFKNDVLLKRVK